MVYFRGIAYTSKVPGTSNAQKCCVGMDCYTCLVIFSNSASDKYLNYFPAHYFITGNNLIW